MTRARSINRKPGRPSQDQSAARAALLDAGLERLVQEGAAALTVKQVAIAAGVTPASLHYHFDDKQGLLTALMEERIMPALSGLQAALVPADSTPNGQIHAFVNAVFDMVEAHPWLPRLWLREVLNEGGALREILIGRVAPMLPQVLASRFADAQTSGNLNTALNPRLLVVSLIGLTLFPLAAEPLWGRIFAPTPPDRSALRQHTLALIEAAFAPASRSP